LLKYILHILNFEGTQMFNGIIDSTEVPSQRGSSSQSSGGSSYHHRTKEDIVNKRMERRLRENEEYNF
jgi:hypothetical protein